MRPTAVFLAITTLLSGAAVAIEWWFPTPQRHGIVVETDESVSVASKAGIRPGDLLLDWLCHGTKRPLDSPYAMSTMDLERYACGREITIEGRRGAAKQSWILPQGRFGLSVRPDFGPAVLSGYLDGERLAGKGEFTAARERWEKIPASVGPGYPWLKSWLLLRLATILNKHGQLHDADEDYREALEDSRRTGPPLVVKWVLYTWAEALLGRSDYNGAEQHFREALTEDKKDNLRNSLTTSLFLNSMGSVALNCVGSA